ncbi:hypothetical protein DFJ73DRAFT_50259 [Zopfochytrium polystomum]|nr:hypothetical protein DFJ73DRAFT_50259 [Zopfochytrium polystomum]
MTSSSTPTNFQTATTTISPPSSRSSDSSSMRSTMNERTPLLVHTSPAPSSLAASSSASPRSPLSGAVVQQHFSLTRHAVHSSHPHHNHHPQQSPVAAPHSHRFNHHHCDHPTQDDNALNTSSLMPPPPPGRPGYHRQLSPIVIVGSRYQSLPSAGPSTVIEVPPSPIVPAALTPVVATAMPLPKKKGSTTIAEGLPRRFWYQVTVVNILLLYFFASHIVVAYRTKPLLFALHPICACLWIILSANATILQQYCNKTSMATASRRVHTALQSTALLCLFIAIGTVYYMRAVTNKSHWESTHAKLGLSTLLSACLIAALGAAAYFAPKRFFGSILRSRTMGLKPHRYIGMLTIALSFLTVSGLALSKWDAKSFSVDTRVAMASALFFSFLSILMGFRS